MHPAPVTQGNAEGIARAVAGVVSRPVFSIDERVVGRTIEVPLKCTAPHSRIAAITGTKLCPVRVSLYSTLGGSTPKSLRSIKPLSVRAFSSRLSTRGAISRLPPRLAIARF